ncbi:MAG TPA: class I SAM-dependent methyltransferase [Gemmatimonadaceae bacterium]|jgi:sarcosine/dimethylglycine N-methyltransferase|nr:class I SAM-dependent methyltransferase [Gemmatimonadaceae bacterium]
MTVRDHYQAGIPDQTALLATVTRAIDAMEPPLTAEKLAAFDQFHVGGLAATAELAKRARITRGMHVLDAGSGLGGPSRFLAETIGCHITGVDLTPAYVAVATLLADRAGLSDTVSYRVGNIVELPFEDGSFDVVWSQHVVMNIPARVPLYRELRRVLKTGGTFAFYDPYLPDTGGAPLYPVPWAETASSSTLLTKQTTIAALEDAGFRMLAFDDITPIGVEWIARQQEQMRQVNALTLGTVMGERMREMAANLGRNLMEGRVRLVMGTCQAV